MLITEQKVSSTYTALFIDNTGYSSEAWYVWS